MNPIIAKARALLDGRERQEAEHAEWRDRHSEEILAAEVDALLNKTARPTITRDYDGLVHKTRDDARARPQPVQEAMGTTPTQQWVEFIDQRIRDFVENYCEEVVGLVGDECGALVREKIAALKSLVKTNHDALYHRQRRFENEYDAYVVNNENRVKIIGPADSAVREVVERAVAPLRQEIRNLRQQLDKSEVLDLPQLPTRRRA